MAILRPINLPTPILISAISQTGLGLYFFLFRRLPYASASERRTAVARPHALRAADITSLFGLLSMGVGMTYLFGSYVPVEENQFLHASVPVRFILSALMAARVLVSGREGMSEAGYWEHLVLAVGDALAAFAVGRSLGRFDGVVPAAASRL